MQPFIKYSLLIIFYNLLLFITYDTSRFYSQYPKVSIFILLFIYLYKQIALELSTIKNKPICPNNLFSKLFGRLIQKNYNFFSNYVGLIQIIHNIVKIDEKNGHFVFTNKYNEYLYKTYRYFYYLVAELLYTWVFLTCLLYHPFISNLISNLLVSLVEFYLTNAEAVEKDSVSKLTAIEKKFHEKTLPHIHPVIITLGTGLLFSSLLKSPSMMSIMKDSHLEFSPFYLSPSKVIALGTTICAFMAGTEYYYLVEKNFIKAITHARMVDVIEPINKHIIIKNAEQHYDAFINLIKNAKSEEELYECAKIQNKLPKSIRMQNIEKYQDAMFEAQNKFKQIKE